MPIYTLQCANRAFLELIARGVATGGISVFIPPKSAQVNFLWGKNDVRTAIQQFYTPQKKTFISPPPQTNFWLRPC